MQTVKYYYKSLLVWRQACYYSKQMLELIVYTLIAISAAMYCLLAVRLVRALRRFRITKQYTAAIEAPSVSVCIPARNEMHAMTECLERVLASDYRKLEVLVYDDSSVDDTSVLIRSFAHAGVRFVEGAPLPEGWLGKNYALDVLAREASGTYVVFLDVDTNISPTTISQLVGYTMTEGMVMSSVIPGRTKTLRANVLFGHLRYVWQLVLSRATAPATSSSLWLIHRRVLLDTIGGFAPHKHEVEPEAHIASIIGTRAYHCLVDTPQLGVTYEKRWHSQVETSRRLLYPTIGGRWYDGVWATIAALLLNVPFVTLVTVVATGWQMYHTVALLVLGASCLLYGVYTKTIWRGFWWVGILLWPVVMLQELVLLLASMIGYARGTITWKGRVVQSQRRAMKQLLTVK